MSLDKIKCPQCGELINPKNEPIKPAYSYNSCLRICEKCELGFSNSRKNPTVIYKSHLNNIPELLRQDIDYSLDNSINIMNRKNKKNKFGFSTSEDALTWSFFKYFAINNKYRDLLNLLNIDSEESYFEIYLWGTSICKPVSDLSFIKEYMEISDSFNEVPMKRTETDVIIKLLDKLIFIEVKYLSPNEIKTNQDIFKKYQIPDVDLEELIKSEHYELLRNWAFVSKLSKGSKFELINLAPKKLFKDKNHNKLSQFENSLRSTNGKFVKLSWEEILEKINNDEYEVWFKKYLNEKLIFNS